MSKSFGYRCLSHETMLESEDWYNHGYDRLNDVLQHRNVILEAFKYLECNTPPEVSWLQLHPTCHVVIGDEYGQLYDDKGEITNEAV